MKKMSLFSFQSSDYDLLFTFLFFLFCFAPSRSRPEPRDKYIETVSSEKVIFKPLIKYLILIKTYVWDFLNVI